ncbi:MAG: hypothetical protein CMH55_08955 [Myxococcales bacterium]|nr:hypothetical protein [Myxococcales bacterium]
MPDAGPVIDGGQEPNCGGCSASQICVLDRCESPCPCPTGQRCNTAGTFCEPGCWTSEDCAESQSCLDDQCQDHQCQVDTHCPEGQLCREQLCREPECETDTDCAESARCDERFCREIGEAPCAADGDCGHGQRCSSYGLCYGGDCLVHGDCPRHQRCHLNRCLDRPTNEYGIQLERRFFEPVTSHYGAEPLGNIRASQMTGYGYGGGLFDMDGDHDLDLFLGTRHRVRVDVDPACLFENRSIPGSLRFVPVPGECEPHGSQDISSAFGLDLEGDGYDELVVLGDGYARLERFHPTRSSENLLDLLPEGDIRRTNCNLGAALPADLDMDGDVDLLLACQLNAFAIASAEEIYRTGVRAYPLEGATYFGCPPGEGCAYHRINMGLPNLSQTFFAQPGQEGPIDAEWDVLEMDVMRNFALFQVDGALVYEEDLIFQDSGATLAFGMVDMNDDGLLDFITANDSYMGLGLVKIHGRGDHLFIADEGPNRLVRYENGASINIVDDVGLTLATRNGTDLESWGTVVEDFDRDGDDDLYVTQGMIERVPISAWADHYDFMALQQDDGRFLILTDEVGVSVHDHQDSLDDTFVYSSRGTVKADLDLDGALDLLTVPFEGHVRLHAEVPLRDGPGARCTLVPRSRYVPTYGYGYAVAAQGTETWFRRDMQGQMRLGASPHVLSSATRGRLRFASGAEIAFDCRGQPGPVVVEEPNWIRWEAQVEGHSVFLHMPWYDGGQPVVRVALRQADGSSRIVHASMDRTRFDIATNASDIQAMLQVDGRWIPRWFELPSP